jgi:PAS domain S-box-containing protein
VLDKPSEKARYHPHVTPEEAEHLVEELQRQAVQLEEQAAELEVANEELSASEAHLRGIIDSALDAIITTDAWSNVIQWNHHAEAMFGWSAEEALARNLNDTIIPPQYREAHERGVQHYLATGEGPILNQRIEITAMRRNGSEFPVELTVAPARWGSRVIFTSFIRDISERKRAERQLAARYAVTRVLAASGTTAEAIPHMLQAICENLGWEMGVFWLVDGRAAILRPAHIWTAPSLEGSEFGRVSCELTFPSGEGLPGRVWASREPAWIPDVTRDPNFVRHAVAARAGVQAGFAFPILAGEDFIGVMEFFQRAVAEPDRALLAAMGAIGSDIAQFIKRKQAEEQLQEQEGFQRFLARVGTKLAAATPDFTETLRKLASLAVPGLADWSIVCLTNEQGQIQRIETAHVDPAKAPVAQVTVRHRVESEEGHPLFQVLRTGQPVLLPEIPDALVETMAQNPEHLEMIRGLGMRSGMVVALRARDRTLGAIVLVSTESGRRFDEDDLEVAQEFARRAALSVDNARLYADAQEANQTKADFLATMSHELRTPLNAMIGYTDLLLLGIPEPLAKSAEEYVKRVALSSRHLLQLIEEILAFSRLEAGRETVVLELVSLSELVSEAEAIIEPLAAEKGLSFRVDAPPEPLQLRTDPRKVRQILVNLLGNAIKFTEAGEVAFTAHVKATQIVLTVSDTGMGIEPEHLSAVFEPFWQVQQTTTRTASGTGLGLSVTQRLVNLLGGSIAVESTPGAGTVFTVCLPFDSGEPGRDSSP